MSAINSNSGDGDLEAIHRAQRAHEPSMEEILASIRNIMADLTDSGYLAQPHTSAGRVPTDRAYRVYIDELMRQLERFLVLNGLVRGAAIKPGDKVKVLVE